jgi:hypothetical protein
VVEQTWTEDELELVGWQWAPEAMWLCLEQPDLWRAWVEHANKNIDPRQTTDSKMGRELARFTEAQG